MVMGLALWDSGMMQVMGSGSRFSSRMSVSDLRFQSWINAAPDLKI